MLCVNKDPQRMQKLILKVKHAMYMYIVDVKAALNHPLSILLIFCMKIQLPSTVNALCYVATPIFPLKQPRKEFSV